MLTEFPTTLSASTNFEYTIRRHAYGCEDICSEIAQPHFHLLFYIKSFVGAKKYFRNTLAITVGNKSGLRDCKVMLWNVTYPENCLKVEMTKSSNTLRIYGERLRKILTSQAAIDLGCQYKVLWEYQRECYSPFSEIDDGEKLPV